MKHFYTLLFIFIIFFPGCNYLDVVPNNDIETIETIFEKRDQAENWFKYCHTFLMPYTTSIISNRLTPELTKLLPVTFSVNNSRMHGLDSILETVYK